MRIINLLFVLLFFGLNTIAQHYEYDDQNRIKKITYLNDQEVFYSYDTDGNRIAESSNSIISLKEITTNEVINIYPNIDTYELNIHFIYTEYDDIIIEFSSFSGEKILVEQISEIEDDFTQIINILALPVGSYILQILSKDDIIISEKVIISDKF